MFSLTTDKIDAEKLRASLAALSQGQDGALAVFEGWVRNTNEGKSVIALTYEAFEKLCASEAETIIQEAKSKYQVTQASCQHRVGPLKIGDLAVWVGATALHRSEAFDACRYIIDQIKSRLPIWKKESYTDGSESWVGCHQGQQASNGDAQINPKEYYARQTILSAVGEAGQEKLGKARVLVVGAGGLGSAVLQQLAASGVGLIGICEPDKLEPSNLHRQTIYAYADCGKPKVELAKQFLENLNPFVKVHAHHCRIEPANVEELISQYDYILDCSDNLPCKFLLNDAVIKLKRTLIQASVYQYEGQLMVLTPTAGQCLRCLFPDPLAADCIGSCTEVGILGPVVSALGSMQALECVKMILNLPSDLPSHILYVDLLTVSTRAVKAMRLDDCPSCGTKSASLEAKREFRLEDEFEIEFEALSYDKFSFAEIVDLRESHECTNDPKFIADEFARRRSQITPGELRKMETKLSKGQTVVLVCQRGMRSNKLAGELRLRGLESVFSLRGGVERAQQSNPMNARSNAK